MKYFAKYLPVEGEIKEGDMAITIRGEIFQATKENNDPIYGDKRIKLFLCSRAIYVGDMITLDGVEFIHYDEGEVDSIWYEHIKKGFKVIGEISKDAAWVKEGDEFNEDELLLYHTTSSGKNYFKIKCSQCKIYH